MVDVGFKDKSTKYEFKHAPSNCLHTPTSVCPSMPAKTNTQVAPVDNLLTSKKIVVKMVAVALSDMKNAPSDLMKCPIETWIVVGPFPLCPCLCAALHFFAFHLGLIDFRSVEFS